MANTVKTDIGVEVYENDIYRLSDEYVDTLNKRCDVEKPNVFTGMIKYINRHIRFEKNIYDSIDILNNIWCSYTDLVYKYNQKPTIEEFALLVGISRETLYSWMRGDTRQGDFSERLGSSRSDTIKKWQEECKIGRYKSAASGNVGGIFLCKAVDGMVETAPVQVENAAQRRTIEQIEQERAGRLPDKRAVPDADF